MSNSQISLATTDLCPQCQTLGLSTWMDSSKHFNRQRVGVGSIADLFRKQTTCSFCYLVFHALRKMCTDLDAVQNPEKHQVQIFTVPSWRHFYTSEAIVNGWIDGNDRSDPKPSELPPVAAPAISGTQNWRIVLDVEPKVARHYWRHEIIITPVAKPTWPRAKQQFCHRLLRPDRLDFDRVRAWHTLCREVHGERCADAGWLALKKPLMPFRVVDVHARTVVDAPEHCRYVALSYVWGTTDLQYELTEADLLQSELKLPNPVQRTIEDAITVTKELRLQYLWVDAFCIVQKPETNDDKSRQLAQMGAIYSSAEIVVLAEGCKSINSGLCGVSSREALNVTRVVDGVELALVHWMSEAEIERTTWASRAWTFQESRLARRALLLGERQASWKCQCDEWYEDTVLEPVFPPRHDFTHRKLPDTSRPPERYFKLCVFDDFTEVVKLDLCVLQAYKDLVTLYTMRHIGRPHDSLNAVSGLLALLQSYDLSRLQTLHYGMPEDYFDWAILWFPKSRFQRPVYDALPLKIPSWSWAGWCSNVGDGVFWSTSTHEWFSTTIPVYPSIHWHLVEADGALRPMPRYAHAEWEWTGQFRMPCGIDTSVSAKAPVALEGLEIPGAGYFLHFLTTSTKAFRVGHKLPWTSDEDDFIGAVPYTLVNSQGELSGLITLSDEIAEPLLVSRTFLDFIFIGYQACWSMFNLPFSGRQPEDDPLTQDVKALMSRKCKSAKMNSLHALWVERTDAGYVERCQIAEINPDLWLAANPTTEWITLG